MQLTVKTLKGEKFTINAEDSNTIAEVKGIIGQQKPELPAATMKLIHSGKVLKDTQTIADCQIKPNAFLVVMITKAKKSASTPVPAPVPTPAASTESKKEPATAAVPVATPAPAATTETTTTSATSTTETATTSTPAPATATEPISAPEPPASDDLSAENVANLVAMGFPEAEVRACLRASQGNADVAVEFLMNGIPEYAQQASSNAAPSTPANTSSSTSSSSEPLAQLRNHPQINELRRLVQSNPSTLQAVLTQIGQQQPEILQEINSNQELFLQIMNEPVSENAPAPLPVPVTNTSSPSANAPAGISPDMLSGMGMGNPAQMAQMIDGMTPEQLQSMASMMGIPPDHLRMTAQAISRMPPAELQNYMNMAMQGGDMEGMMGEGGGAGRGGPHVLELSQEEMAAVDRLAGMGFDRSEAAQAYLACDKNEELAANLLMDGGFGFGDFPSGGGDAPGGGAGGNNGDDDMYD